MSYYMNVDEVYQVGVEIEKNGQAFYQAAAAATGDPAVKKLCEGLAAWETRHVEVFEKLRRELPPEARADGAFDPADEERAYLRAAADDHVFRKGTDIPALVAKCQTPKALLDLAIQFEKDSVVYYTAMKQLMPPCEACGSVDALIDEELRHIAMLAAQRSKAAG